ncbi:MAG: hypothetical protein Q4D06_05300 [Coriobacteriia bacterium]|nr:hypothetical protein [Coriobacteriia bacterium]
MTLTSRKFSNRAIVAAVVLLCAVLAACAVLANSIAADVAQRNGCDAVREAILRSSMQCCAVEGAYPATLGYLEKNYGLVINHSAYVVMYDCVAENVPPTVKVELK